MLSSLWKPAFTHTDTHTHTHTHYTTQVTRDTTQGTRDDPLGPLDTQVVFGHVMKGGFPTGLSMMAWVAQSSSSIRYEIIYVI